MTNKEIITYIYKKRNSLKENIDNSRMKTFLNYIDNPQDKLKFIHIAGTNGKGSTTTMMANVLKNSGYKVGKFISPFIISFNERIQINNIFITDEELIIVDKEGVVRHNNEKLAEIIYDIVIDESRTLEYD